MVLCGLGGIYIEVLKDVQSGLSPVSKEEAHQMIKGLRSYKIIEGVRGQEGVNEDLYVDVIRRVSALCEAAPEIMEMDINPLIGNLKRLTAVDARILIRK
jgi:acetate---CoA ligase (ADP-forming)